jgi:hypothetical protein
VPTVLQDRLTDALIRISLQMNLWTEPDSADRLHSLKGEPWHRPGQARLDSGELLTTAIVQSSVLQERQ